MSGACSRPRAGGVPGFPGRERRADPQDDDESGATRSALLCTLNPRGEGAPLFLVPSVGTTPLSLVRLARSIAPQRPVHAFAYAGMEDDLAPHLTLEAMANACLVELLALSPQGPYLLGGHCLGGAVALEIALQLEARGEAVAHLVVLDTIAPPLADAGREAVGPGRGEPARAVLDSHVRRILEAIVARTVSHYAMLPPEVAQRLGGVLQLHLAAGNAYRARPLGAPIDVLCTQECHGALLAGWRHIAAGALSRQAIPGDTFSMLRPPHVGAVGRSLGAILQDAD